MPRILIIVLSLLLSLGVFADKYLPFLKELTIGALFVHTVFFSNNISVLIKNARVALPLLFIFLSLFIIGAFSPYHLDGESPLNLKFLIAIFFFVVLSTFFSIYPKYVQVSLIAFGIGGGLLSIVFALGLFGEGAYEIRNDRLFLLGENPNSLSVRISLGILFLVWGLIENDLKLTKLFRFLLIVPIPFMFSLILMTGSKGSFLLCIGSIVLYVLFLKNVSDTIKKIILFFSAIAVFFALSFFFQSTLYERFLTSDLTSGRSGIWNAAMDIFTQYPLGVGEIGYQVEINQRTGRFIDTHNLFIYLLVTGGFVTFFLFIYFLYRLLLKNLRYYSIHRNIIYLIILVSMVFVMSKTGGVLSYLIMWYFLASVNGLPVKFKRELS